MNRLIFILGVLISAGSVIARTGPASGPDHSDGVVSSKAAKLRRAEKQALFQQAGVPKTHRRYYVVDRLVPRELGGSNDRSNLQIQSKAEAKAKDRIERYLVARVKKGEISVEEARKEVQDWKHLQIAHRLK